LKGNLNETDEISKISNTDVVSTSVKIEQFIFQNKSLPYKETIRDKILLLNNPKADNLRLGLLRGDITINDLMNKSPNYFLGYEAIDKQ